MTPRPRSRVEPPEAEEAVHLFQPIRTGVDSDTDGAQMTRRPRKMVPRRVRVAADAGAGEGKDGLG